MTDHQADAVCAYLKRNGPMPAKRISTALAWPPTKTYGVLVELEAMGVVGVCGRKWQAMPGRTQFYRRAA